MRTRSRRQFLAFCVAVALAGCSDAPVEFATENSGGILHQISTDPTEIFRNKVDRQAELEARGIEPPVGNASWREYWRKVIAYYSGTEAIGTHEQIAAYVVHQRQTRGLPPL